MKHKYQIILISILFLSFSNEMFKIKKCAEGDEKVLLIHYWVDSDFKVIKEYKSAKKRVKYLSGTPVDCMPYPIYNKYNRTFEINGFSTVTEMSKIIFWTNCDVMDINLPFHYEDIKLDSLINDSIVGFTWFNSKHLSNPGQEVCDSLVTIEKEGKRVIQRTEVYHLMNYGLIYKKNISTYEERMKRENEKNRIRDSIERDELFKRYKIER